ncbi:unnamed protein product [Tuber melanosporum]|uniref:(Perigord truffle) hypothetical protein n=1 Tax=Tuber melanosporum (strain Mel28) TaxID=656061 RepID=D5G6V7_TUBMM|nr:uncharacterized protein GSTUM_00002295001 [Tuber melanosporum]CAZ80250.1 unnamed protein product [Tuber melanosporum]
MGEREYGYLSTGMVAAESSLPRIYSRALAFPSSAALGKLQPTETTAPYHTGTVQVRVLECEQTKGICTQLQYHAQRLTRRGNYNVLAHLSSIRASTLQHRYANRRYPPFVEQSLDETKTE